MRLSLSYFTGNWGLVMALHSEEIFSERYLTTELLKNRIQKPRAISVKIPLGYFSKSLKLFSKSRLPTLMHLE